MSKSRRPTAGLDEASGQLGFRSHLQLPLPAGDTAIGVSRNCFSSNIVKGNPFANSGRFRQSEVDKLFAEAAAAPTDDERQRLYTKVQQIIVDEVPILWLLELEYPTIYRCDIKDLVTTAVGVDDGFRDARKN